MEAVTHHRPLLEDELRRMRELLLAMGDRVDEAIDAAVRALTDRDVQGAARVLAADRDVNAAEAEVRELAFTLILTQQPVARDLREIISILHMASELERMGDHCVNVARTARDLADLPALSTYVDLPVLGRLCAEQLRDILSAVVARDCERGRAVAAADDRVNRVYHRIVDDLLQMMVTDSSTVYAGTRMMMVALNLERIGDRVTNLAEDLVFLENGDIEDLG